MESASSVRRSLIALMVANLMPLVGVFTFGWSVGELLIVYWAENVVVGLYNIPKILRAKKGNASVVVRLVIALFFMLHYGGFTLVHGAFVYVFAVKLLDADSFGVLEFLSAFVSLVASHGYSYRVNFIGAHEYRNVSPMEQMGKPYARVMVLHLTIILGALLAFALRLSQLFAVVLVALKIFVDGRLHVRAHRFAARHISP